MYEVKTSTSLAVSFFAHDINGDAVIGIADGSWTNKRISKNGAAFGAMTVTITEMERGFYSFTLSSSHTDTNGILSVLFTSSTSKQVNLQWRVATFITDDLATPTNITAGTITTATNVTTVNGLAANVITATSINADAITAAKIANGAIDAATFAAGAIDAAAIATGAIDADALAADAAAEIRSVVRGTAASGTTTTMVDAALTQADTDFFKGQVILFTSGTLLGQARLITAFTPASDTVTFSPATTVAVGTHTYEILPGGRVDVEQWLGTTVATPTVAGVPEVDVTHWIGTVAATPTIAGVPEVDVTHFNGTSGTFSAGRPEVNTSHAAGTAWGSGAITAGAIATGAIDADALATDAVNEIRDAVWAQVMTELGAVPGVTGTTLAALEWLFLLARNKRTTTATTETLRNDADAGNVSTSTVSDDGTTFTRGEWA